MGLRPSTLPLLLSENEQIASQMFWEDVIIERLFAGIGMILMLDGAGGCFDCGLSSTSGVISHNMSSDATVRISGRGEKVQS